MSTIPILGSVAIKGSAEMDSSIYLTGDVRPCSPPVQNVFGTYTLDAFSADKYRSAEYLIQISQPANYAVCRVLVLHDGTNAYLTEYGRVETSAFMSVEFQVILVEGLVTLSYSQPSMATVVKSLASCLNK